MKKKLYIKDDNRITIRVWQSSLVTIGELGHASLQTYKLVIINGEEKSGIYVSFWPGQLSKNQKKLVGVEGYCSESLEEDIGLESDKEPDNEINLYSLNVDNIHTAYKNFLNGKINWSLMGSSYFKNPKTFNCSGLIWYLLKAGEIKERLFDDNFLPIDGPFGTLTGGFSTPPKSLLLSILGSTGISMLIQQFNFNLNIKQGVMIGSLIGCAIGGGLTWYAYLFLSAFNSISIGQDGANTINNSADKEDIPSSTIIGKTALECTLLSTGVCSVSIFASKKFGMMGIAGTTLISSMLGFIFIKTMFNLQNKLVDSVVNKTKVIGDNTYIPHKIVARTSIILSNGIAGSLFYKDMGKWGLIGSAALTTFGIFASSSMINTVASLAITPNDIARIAINAHKMELKKFELVPESADSSYEAYSAPSVCNIF